MRRRRCRLRAPSSSRYAALFSPPAATGTPLSFYTPRSAVNRSRRKRALLAGGHRFRLHLTFLADADRFLLAPEPGKRLVLARRDDRVLQHRERASFSRAEHTRVEHGEHVVLDDRRLLDWV